MMEINRELLKRILVYLKNHHDTGDYRETWQSEQLKKDIAEVSKVLGNGNAYPMVDTSYPDPSKYKKFCTCSWSRTYSLENGEWICSVCGLPSPPITTA